MFVLLLQAVCNRCYNLVTTNQNKYIKYITLCQFGYSSGLLEPLLY